MERLRRLLAVYGSVTVHVVAAKVVVEQTDLMPAILNANEQQHRVALDRPPRTAEPNDHPIGKRPLDALLVWHPVRLSDAWDGTLGRRTAAIPTQASKAQATRRLNRLIIDANTLLSGIAGHPQSPSSTLLNAGDHELVVAADGSIPADQLKRLGVSPCTHLRVVETPVSTSAGSIAGSLSHLAEVSWEDFQRASELAERELRAEVRKRAIAKVLAGASLHGGEGARHVRELRRAH